MRAVGLEGVEALGHRGDLRLELGDDLFDLAAVDAHLLDDRVRLDGRDERPVAGLQLLDREDAEADHDVGRVTDDADEAVRVDGRDRALQLVERRELRERVAWWWGWSMVVAM